MTECAGCINRDTKRKPKYSERPCKLPIVKTGKNGKCLSRKEK
jgi:hypothetical protein